MGVPSFGVMRTAAAPALNSPAVAGLTKLEPAAPTNRAMRGPYHSFQPLCIGRVSILLASSLPTNCSFFGSHFSFCLQPRGDVGDQAEVRGHVRRVHVGHRVLAAADAVRKSSW